jgi:hypothetical protein
LYFVPFAELIFTFTQSLLISTAFLKIPATNEQGNKIVDYLIARLEKSAETKTTHWASTMLLL